MSRYVINLLAQLVIKGIYKIEDIGNNLNMRDKVQAEIDRIQGIEKQEEVIAEGKG